MNKNTMNVVKGVAIGMAAGMAVGYVGKKAKPTAPTRRLKISSTPHSICSSKASSDAFSAF